MFKGNSPSCQLLMNSSGDFLDVADEEKIREVADYICRLRYQGLNHESQLLMARLAAGILPAKIIERFLETIDSQDRAGSFMLMSAHDNTILALLAQLGFRNFPVPSFAAHIIFELHQEENGYFVKILYNEDPQFSGFASEDLCLDGTMHACDYFIMPPRGQTEEWDKRQPGQMLFSG